MNYCFRIFYKELKKYVKDSSISDETFLNELLSSVIDTYELTDKYDSELHFEKTKTSKIINGKENVPTIISKAIKDDDYLDEVKEAFGYFVEDNIINSKLKTLSKEFKLIINESDNIDSDTKERLTKLNENDFLFECFVESFLYPNKITTDKELIWANGSNKIFKIEGDLFNTKAYVSPRQRSIIVIPVNTGFDIHITRKYENDNMPLVSETTIHGYWINKMNKTGISCEEIQKLINSNIKSQKIKAIGKSKTKNSNQNIYPIGTVAIVQYKKQDYYLLAISDFDKNNNAHSTRKQLEVAIEKLIKFYDRNGQGYKMFIPLIGTGRSRAGLTHRDSFNLILNTFSKLKEYINGEIYIVDKGNNL